MMTRIVWLDQYDTGIPEIDSQHRQIVDYLNQLFDAGKNKNSKAVQDVVEGIVDYTMSHFAFEEALMEEAQYPFVRAHRSVHEAFIKRVDKFQARLLAGEDIGEEFYAVLRRWLINHIQRDDAAYVRAVQPHLAALAGEMPVAAENAQESWISRAVKTFFRTSSK